MKRFFGAVQDSFNKENVKLDTIEDRDEAIYVGRNGEVFAYATRVDDAAEYAVEGMKEKFGCNTPEKCYQLCSLPENADACEQITNDVYARLSQRSFSGLSSALVINGQPGKKYVGELGLSVENFTQINPDTLRAGTRHRRVFTDPRGRHIVYVATNGDGHVVVIDNVEKYGPFIDNSDIIRGLIFSADGNRHAFIAYDYKQQSDVLFLDGLPASAFTSIRDFAFSDNGRQYAFIGVGFESNEAEFDRRYEQSEGDCRESPSCQTELLTYYLYLHHYEREVAAVEVYSLDNIYKPQLVVNGTEKYSYDVITPPVFSPDGQHIAYAAQKNGQWSLYKDHQAVRALERPVHGFFKYSFQSDSYVYVSLEPLTGQLDQTVDDLGADQGYQVRVIYPDRVSELRDTVIELVMSPDGTRVGYVVRTPDGDYQVIVDEQANVPSGEVAGFHFSPDSQHYIYKDYGDIIIDGQRKMENANNLVAYGLPFFSPDSSSVAFAAYYGDQHYIVVDKAEIPVDHQIVSDIYFSPDSEYIGYGAIVRDNELWWIAHKVK